VSLFEVALLPNSLFPVHYVIFLLVSHPPPFCYCGCSICVRSTSSKLLFISRNTIKISVSTTSFISIPRRPAPSRFGVPLFLPRSPLGCSTSSYAHFFTRACLRKLIVFGVVFFLCQKQAVPLLRQLTYPIFFPRGHREIIYMSLPVFLTSFFLPSLSPSFAHRSSLSER